MGDRPHEPPRAALRAGLRPAGIAVVLTLAACGGGPTPGGAPVPATASEAEWLALATARPDPVDGAARVSMGDFRMLAAPGWAAGIAVDPGLGMAELVSAGLMRRRDVHFVERRRFAAAAARERQGLPRAPGAPAAGVSPGAELLLNVVWSSIGLDSTYLDLRLVEAGSGAVAHTGRVPVPEDADPVSVARRVVGGVAGVLREAGRLPAWEDPEPMSATQAYGQAGVPRSGIVAFFQGLAAEERWDWEGARRGYQAALRASVGFFEARTALARAARLRMGGTLGAN